MTLIIQIGSHTEIISVDYIAKGWLWEWVFLKDKKHYKEILTFSNHIFNKNGIVILKLYTNYKVKANNFISVIWNQETHPSNIHWALHLVLKIQRATSENPNTPETYGGIPKV